MNGPIEPAHVEPLANGDRLNQAEFHRRYAAYPDEVKFELIGGTVYMASPLSWPHSQYHQPLAGLFWIYAAGTPGVASGNNATTVLGDESEPQPDLLLRILHECGGNSQVKKRFLHGPPELLAEIALSSRSIDLHQKRIDYERAGVVEYLVFCVEEQTLHWFHFPSSDRLEPDRLGVVRSRVFPGLWIQESALIEGADQKLIKTLQRGLASSAHIAFVKQLAAQRRRSTEK